MGEKEVKKKRSKKMYSSVGPDVGSNSTERIKDNTEYSADEAGTEVAQLFISIALICSLIKSQCFGSNTVIVFVNTVI
jgi:hypothetical protein